jgi:division/cell wall cluster transcriptional repressor MraZ
MRFLGNIEAKTDAKGRAFLPAQFRKVLSASGEESLVLRQDVFEKILVIYPESVWCAMMDEMRAKLSRWDRQQQMVYRTFVSSVINLAVDGNGRILIPNLSCSRQASGRPYDSWGWATPSRYGPTSPTTSSPSWRRRPSGRLWNS